MLINTGDKPIYIANEPVDMRKSIDGLSILVVEYLEMNPQDSALFIFYNRCRNKVKCLLWDNNGFVMIYKRLEKGRFKFHRNIDLSQYEIDNQQLHWLLAGFDFIQLNQHPELKFAAYS